MGQNNKKKTCVLFSLFSVRCCIYIPQVDLQPEPTAPNTAYLKKVRMLVRLKHPSKPKEDRFPPLGRWKVIY